MKNSIRLLEAGILIALILGLGVFVQMTAWAGEVEHPYACLLNFERKIHPLSQILERKFGKMDGVKLINEARPIDMLKCLDEGASSLILITHAGELPTGKQVTAPLVYFRELKGEERQQALENYKKQLDQVVAEYKEMVRTDTVPAVGGERYYHAFELDQKIAHYPADAPIYSNPWFENQIFRRILQDPEKLKKLSIVSCLPKLVANYYPELGMLKKDGVDVEFGPTNKFFTWLFGKQVSSPDYGWIKQNLSESKKLAEDPVAEPASRVPASATQAR